MRTFVAIELPAKVRSQVMQVRQELQTLVAEAELKPTVRWPRIENIHLTLRFLGETDTRQREILGTALSQICNNYTPFELVLQGIGCFPNHQRPRTLWLGVDGDLPMLNCFQGEVEELAQAAGFRPERRPFSPHITVGRTNRGASRDELIQLGEVIRKAARELMSPPEAGFVVHEIVYLRSDLHSSGAIYTPLTRIPLAD
jgi:2'-5' RNA ligase